LVIGHSSFVIGKASVGATRLHKLTTLIHSIGSGRPLLKLMLHKRVSPLVSPMEQKAKHPLVSPMKQKAKQHLVSPF
jgi:hypothetical protein